MNRYTLGLLAIAITLTTPFVRASSGSLADGARLGETTTVLADGRVLIAGGDAQGTAEIYEPATGLRFTLDAPMSSARAYHSAVLLADGNVLIIGGYAAGTSSIEGSAELFVAATGTFVKAAAGPWGARVQPQLTRRDDGVVVVSGGGDPAFTEFYDPATGTFGTDPAAPSIVTDRGDYAPGETVTFIGRRWTPGGTVRITLREWPDVHADRELFATVDELGEFVNTEFAPEPHDLGVTFMVTAVDMTWGREAWWTFTDAAQSSTSYSILPFTGTVLGGGVDTGNHSDDGATLVTVPFPVVLYDQTVTAITVGANGWIAFGGSSSAFSNQALPDSGFGAAIFPYFDDLVTSTSVAGNNPANGIFTQVTGTAPNRVFHIRWQAQYFDHTYTGHTGCFACGTGSVSFEVRLHETLSQFDVVYGPGTAGHPVVGSTNPNGATVGVQRTATGPSTQYAPTPNVDISTRNGVMLTFLGDGTTGTTTALASSLNPGNIGLPVTLTATVTHAGAPVTSGSVTLTEGATTLAGPATVNASGQASFSQTLSPGAHTLTATFSGNGTFSGSSGLVTQTILGPTTTMASSPNPSVFGQPVTLTAQVGGPVPPGSLGTTVQFRADGVNIGGPVTVSAGVATLSTSTLAAGTHTLTALYPADAGSLAASASVSQIVTTGRSTTTLSISGATAAGKDWSPKAPMAAARQGSAAGVINGIVYVAGGEPAPFGLQAYTVATDTWADNVAQTGATHIQDAVSGVMNGKLYVAGGALPTYGTTIGTGTLLGGGVDIGNHTDDGVTVLSTANGTLPFAIGLYDQSFTAITVSANGWISFGGSSFTYINQALPDPGFGATIFPYFDDLVTNTDVPGNYFANGIFALVTGTAPNRVFHLRWQAQYYDFPYTGHTGCGPCGTGSASFEVLLHESLPQFDVIYGPGTNSPTSTLNPTAATVGVQQNAAGPYTQYAGTPNVSLSTLTGVKLSFILATDAALSTVRHFDPTTGAWTSDAVMPWAVWQSAGGVINNVLYVVGGSDEFGAMLNRTAAFNSTSGSWSQKASMPGTGVRAAASAVLGGKLYVAGGVNSAGVALKTLFVYNPVTNTWGSLNAMPTARGFATAAAFDNKLYVIGGWTPAAGHTLTTVEVYDPATNTWSTASPLPLGRSQAVALPINDTIYVMGGDRTVGGIETAQDDVDVLLPAFTGTYPQSAVLQATVQPQAPSVVTPAGTATFLDGATVLGTGTVDGAGQASLSVSLLPGSHVLTASYGGSSGYSGSASFELLDTVADGSSTTTLSLSANPSVYGQPVTYTATVTTSGFPVSGTVTFTSGGVAIGTVPLVAGTATLPMALPAGALPQTNSIVAVFNGTAGFVASTSAAVSQTVNRAGTATSLTSTANPSVPGQSVSLTATVAPLAPGAGVPSSTVTFRDGATTIGVVALSGGTATLTTAALSTAAHAITAAYSGDTAFTPSTSATLPQTVALAITTTTVTCPVAPLPFTGAAWTPCTATVTGGGLSLTPTPLYSSNTNVGTATAFYNYGGDATHAASSNTKTFSIAKAPSTTTVTCPVAAQIYSGAALTPCTVAVVGVFGVILTPAPAYTTNTNVGTANATYAFAGDASHTASSDAKTFVIAQATTTTTVSCPVSQTYSGAALTPCTVSVTGGGLNLHPAPVYSSNTDVGTAGATYTYAGDTNHNGSTDAKTFAIAQATSTTTVTCPFPAQIYSGAPFTPCTVTVTGAGGLSLTPIPSYSNNTNVGLGSATYTFAGDANHTGSTQTKMFTIAKAPSTTTVTCPVAAQTYTGAALAPCTVTVTGAVGLSLTPNATYTANTNVGTANATYAFAGDGTHTASTNTKTFAIAQAPSTTMVTCPASQPFTGAALTPCTVTVTGAGGLSLTPAPVYANNTNVGTASGSYTFAGDANHTGSSDTKGFAITESCDNALPSVSFLALPLNHELRSVTIGGLTAATQITAICQDENPNLENIAAYAMDGGGIGTATAQVRAEISGTRAAPSNGRVYTISFTAPALGCSGSIKVRVNVSATAPPAVDGGPLWNSVTGANSCAP